MKRKVNSSSFYHLSILLITLAGFAFLIASSFYVQGNEFAFKASDEVIQQHIAKEASPSNFSFFTISVDGRSLFEQSAYYFKLYSIFSLIGIFLIILSFYLWYKGSLAK
ncbi:MAG: hypothetical protein PHH00_01290 [Candidatus Nanoarchaeia archaeon]|nr:hypothetical protein [Candidatus Nanoarchaeia archaeon]